MRVVTARDYDQMSRKAAFIFAAQLVRKPDSVLGLATGDTPKGLYRELIRMHREGDIDFSSASSFNLDEYVGLRPDDPQSYRHYMREQLFSHVNIRPESTRVPDGTAGDLDAECVRYESALRSAGGADIQVLGLGTDGHIGFNEPDQEFPAATHIVRLDESTIEANSRFFRSREEVPTMAITMGIGTIMSARSIVLLASGRSKAEPVRGMVRGPITPRLPASVLQLHPDVTVILDEEAASLL
jgi:glucosamine-6-phosphate deaminase